MILLLLLVTPLLANICQPSHPDGSTWMYSLADGVTDFYHTGVNLNKSHFCFEGCLKSGGVVQDYKVKMAPRDPDPDWWNLTKVERVRRPKLSNKLSNTMGDPDDYDNNAFTCPDDTLRKEVFDTLQKVTDTSAKGVARSLQYSLARPGWAITVVVIDGMVSELFLINNNFCLYETTYNEDIYNIRLAAIDFS